MDLLTQIRMNYFLFFDALHREGFLDDQFNQLQKLQDNENPRFVLETVNVFLEDAEKLVWNISTAFKQPIVAFQQIDSDIHQLIGSSSSVGAARIKNTCTLLKSFWDVQNREECINQFPQLELEYYLLKMRLQHLLTMEEQYVKAGGTLPVTRVQD